MQDVLTDRDRLLRMYRERVAAHADVGVWSHSVTSLEQGAC